MKFKYKSGDIVVLKNGGFSWHIDNPTRKFYGRITNHLNFIYLLYIFGIGRENEDWCYAPSEIERLATEDERIKLFLEEI